MPSDLFWRSYTFVGIRFFVISFGLRWLTAAPATVPEYCALIPPEDVVKFPDCREWFSIQPESKQQQTTLAPSESDPERNEDDQDDRDSHDESVPASRQSTESDKENPNALLSDELFEGDIAGIDPGVKFGLSADTAANGIKDETKRWPRADVPYKISPNFRAQDRAKIMEAMNGYHKTTCVRFRPAKRGDSDLISIMSAFSGCNSYVGKIGGVQFVNLALAGCMKVGIIQHELMHALGFYHEQARTDRDEFVELNTANIPETQQLQFQKYMDNEVVNFGAKYDFASVMHYGKNDFGKNKEEGQWTIRPRQKYMQFIDEMGQRNGLSPTDINKVNAMYKCTMAGPCERGWTTFEKKCYFFSFLAGDDESGKKTFVKARNYCRMQGALIAGPSDHVISKLIVPKIQGARTVEDDDDVWVSGCQAVSLNSPEIHDADCDIKSYFICQRQEAEVHSNAMTFDEQVSSDT